MWQAFNVRPEGATSSQPRASERSERHPGLGRKVSDTPPKGAKATTERINYATSGHYPRQSRAPIPPIAGTTPATRRKHRHSRRQPPTNIPPVTAFAPSGGASFAPPPNPGCRIASLACPGLGTYCPFGARVERMTHAYNPIAHKSFNARPEGLPRVCHAFNARPEGNSRVCHAFNARPEGATSSQPRASERSERHPGLGRRISDTPPKGAKATTERIHYATRGHYPRHPA